jgi:hypothetical protein
LVLCSVILNKWTSMQKTRKVWERGACASWIEEAVINEQLVRPNTLQASNKDWRCRGILMPGKAVRVCAKVSSSREPTVATWLILAQVYWVPRDCSDSWRWLLTLCQVNQLDSLGAKSPQRTRDNRITPHISLVCSFDVLKAWRQNLKCLLDNFLIEDIPGFGDSVQQINPGFAPRKIIHQRYHPSTGH